jgi:Flp pilus assembly pilin Flp
MTLPADSNSLTRRDFFRALVRRQDGASMVEYGMALGLIVAVTIGVVSFIRNHRVARAYRRQRRSIRRFRRRM